MFSKNELMKISTLVEKDIDLSDYFTKEERDAFGTALPCIKEDFFIPKHSRKIMTIRLKKLYVNENVLIDTVRKLMTIVQNVFEIRIGISILVHVGAEMENIRYYFSIFSRPLNESIKLISSQSDAEKLLSFIKLLRPSDVLSFTFNQINHDMGLYK